MTTHRTTHRATHRTTRTRTRARAGAAVLTAALIMAACGDDGDDGAASPDAAPEDLAGRTVTLVAYDSFPVGDTSMNDALDSFTADTGIEVELLSAGDTGAMVSKAVLTAGNPEGDVMWGIDNTFLSRALADDVFEPYESPAAASIPDALTDPVPGNEVTPVDYGDVCINYDIAWFDEQGLTPPTTLDDLLLDDYADLLVVQNPATSSPGLAFLLATVATYGDDGWAEYWSGLRANGVEVVEGWSEAYYERFTWAGGGPRPLVVSYGSSPPAEVIFADPPRDDAPTGVMESSCFRQIEFAGVLRGTGEPEAARALVDFLVSETFQAELPLNVFVYPANPDVELPTEFVDHAVVPDDPLTVDPERIEEHRSAWIDEWTDIVLG
jgi:thiamine transport system substrate-binding protein